MATNSMTNTTSSPSRAAEQYDEYYLVTIEGGITLESQQAIVKFTLVDKADATTPMNVTRLEVYDGYYNIFVEPVSPTNALYGRCIYL